MIPIPDPPVEFRWRDTGDAVHHSVAHRPERPVSGVDRTIELSNGRAEGPVQDLGAAAPIGGRRNRRTKSVAATVVLALAAAAGGALATRALGGDDTPAAPRSDQRDERAVEPDGAVPDPADTPAHADAASPPAAAAPSPAAWYPGTVDVPERLQGVPNVVVVVLVGGGRLHEIAIPSGEMRTLGLATNATGPIAVGRRTTVITDHDRERLIIVPRQGALSEIDFIQTPVGHVRFGADTWPVGGSGTFRPADAGGLEFVDELTGVATPFARELGSVLAIATRSASTRSHPTHDGPDTGMQPWSEQF